MFARLMGLQTISPQELHLLAKHNPMAIFDVNSPQSFMQAHVPGAFNMDPAVYKDTELPADKTSALVFYCSNTFCRKAPNAARRAKGMGYSNVKVMSAGIRGWIAANLPTEGTK